MNEVLAGLALVPPLLAGWYGIERLVDRAADRRLAAECDARLAAANEDRDVLDPEPTLRSQITDGPSATVGSPPAAGSPAPQPEATFAGAAQ